MPPVPGVDRPDERVARLPADKPEYRRLLHLGSRSLLCERDLALRIFVALVCGGVFLVLTRTIFKVSIEASETAAYRRVAKGLRNPRRIRDAQLRIAFLTLSVVLSYPLWFAYITLHLRFVLLTEALIILTTVVLYVLACDPLPPCAGKVKEWFRGMPRGADRVCLEPVDRMKQHEMAKRVCAI